MHRTPGQQTMSETPARRVSSLPTKEPSVSSHISSTLYNTSTADSQNLSLPTSSIARAVGPHPPGPVAHARRQAAGGFLLDSSGSRKSSLDRTDRSLYYQSSVGSGQVGKQDGGDAEVDSDPAAMVDLVLSESQKRKGETASLSRQKSSWGNTLSLPLSRHQGTSEPGSRRRALSPTRSFMMSGRSPSSAGAGKKHLASSPPPAPGRANFPTPSLPPRPFGGKFQQQQMRRWSQGREQLREFQMEYKFSEATMQRTLKAKQSLELAAAFKELLKIESTRAKNMATLRTPKGFLENFCEYNPLRVIRNRKLRNRKKIQLDISRWEDPGVVAQWVEDVAVSIHSPGGEGAGGLPHPPPGEGRKQKRSRMDWVIEPEEMLADYYWMRCEEYKREELEKESKRRKRQSVQSMESMRDKQRMSLEVSPNDLGYVVSDDNMKKRASRELPRARRAKEYRRFSRDNDEGFESTATSSEEDEQSDSDYLSDSSGSEYHHNTGDALPESPKHHRRRRKLKRIIKGKNPSGKKLKQHELELEEKWRKQEAEAEMDWVVSENEESYPILVLHDQPEYRKSFEADEEYESATTGRSPIKPLEKTITGLSFSTAFGGSEGSLDRVDTAAAGLGIIGSVADRSDYVIPSIAISLSPPRMPSQEPEERDEDKKGSKISPTKKLLGMRKDANSKEKEHVEDSGRDSLDIERPHKKPNEKEKGSKIGKVKSRVDKLRSEVSKVEELIPWKRDNGSSIPSPTISNNTASDDEDRFTQAVSREGTLSALDFEDLELSKSKLGRQIPELRKPRPSKHRSHHSTGQLGLHERLQKNLDSDHDASPERCSNKLKVTTSDIGREPSPARGVKIEPLRQKPEEHLVLDQIKALENPSQLFSDAPEEPIKQCPPLIPPILAISKRDLYRTRASALSEGIVARELATKTPSIFNPRLRQINASTRTLNSLLNTYHSKQTTFVTSTAPNYHNRINEVNKHISHTLTPMVRTVADEADGLSTTVTTEMTLNVKKLQEEIFRLARRRRGRGKMRRVIRVLSVTIEWSVRAVLWVIWIVVLALKITKKIVELVVGVAKWVLWL